MAQSRTKGICSGCGLEREIYDVKNTLCNSCWRCRDRWVKAGGNPGKWQGKVGRDSEAIPRDQGKFLKLHAALLGTLAKLRCSTEEINEVLAVVEPRLKPIAEWIKLPAELKGQVATAEASPLSSIPEPKNAQTEAVTVEEPAPPPPQPSVSKLESYRQRKARQQREYYQRQKDKKKGAQAAGSS